MIPFMMRLDFKKILIILPYLLLTSCSNDPYTPASDKEMVYSFTAVLNNRPGTRLSYEEDQNKTKMKMVWDDGDVIRLYPDEKIKGTNDPEYYEFIANTGAGTDRTVFVHQGYITHWENWTGRAIYVFPDEDNLNVDPDNPEEFLTKSFTQKCNNNTEHLRYAEHQLLPDGRKGYTEYWSDDLVDYNLKHDHEMHFSHPHTLIYKIMLRGLLYDVPGGSLLKVSGASWAEKTISLNLGNKDDATPFVQVGDIPGTQYGDNEYKDNPLVAYIIRQVPASSDIDAEIKKGEHLKFELFTYDPDDGKHYPLNPKDNEPHRHHEYMLATAKDGSKNYFVDLPWGEEYTWEVAASQDIQYRAGDYVVADLLDTNNNSSYPHVAVDLGLTQKWASCHVGATKIDDSGSIFLYANTTKYSYSSVNFPTLEDNKLVDNDQWTKQADPNYDAATRWWGDDWRMPTFFEMIDLFQYTKFTLPGGEEITSETIFDPSKSWIEGEKQLSTTEKKDLSYAWNTHEDQYNLFRLCSNWKKGREGEAKCIYIPLSGTNNSKQGEYGRFFATGVLLAEDAGIASTSRVILNYCCRHTITGSGWFQKINTGISIESSINPKECAYSIRPVKRDKNEPSKIIYYPFDKNMPSTPQRK